MTILLVVTFFMYLFTFSFPQIGYFLGDNHKISTNLEIEKMYFNIEIYEGFANVRLTEIVKNNSSKTREGFFFSKLYPDSTIDDFVIYRDLLRLPAVIMTKKKAKELYDYITWFERDPGLLETSYTYGSESTELPYGSNKFSVYIYPIPSYGFKRIEFSYIEPLKYKNGKEVFTLPLSSENFRNIETANNLTIKLKIKNQIEIKPNTFSANLNFTRKSNEYYFSAKNFTLNKNLQIKYEIIPDYKKIYFSGYLGSRRDFLKGRGIGIYKEFGKNFSTTQNGYFLAEKFTKKINKTKIPKNVFILVDFSLSMKWSNIKKLYYLLTQLIESLDKNSTFNVYIFNRNFTSTFNSPLKASIENKKKAEEFLNNSYFIDGTDVLKGLREAIKKISEINEKKDLILIGDFIPTLDEIDNSKISREVKNLNTKNLKIYSFGIGDNVNDTLLKNISESYININALSSNEIVEAIKSTLYGNFLTLKLSGNETFYDIFPSYLKQNFGTRFCWFGRFKKEKQSGVLKINGSENINSKVSLKNINNKMKFIPKLWAKSKIDYLLKRINEEGEKEKYVKEIVELSKEYKIITPYTSMLAAPRSFLRPRFIQPGDPIIKVKAPDNVNAVSALLPTGKNLSLTYIKSKKIWAGKFILPTNFKDGKYPVEIILRSNSGEIIRERKTITIDTHPPIFKVNNLKEIYGKGEILNLKINSPIDTKKIVAIIPGGGTYEIKWNKIKKICEGQIKLPSLSGEYKLKIISQDFAQNLYSRSFTIEIK